MRFSIHTLGTRGDFQPYLALALGLKACGHEVLLVAPAQFGDAVAARGVNLAPLPSGFLEMLDAPEVRSVIGKSGAGFGAGLKLLKRYHHLMRDLLDAEWEAARDFQPEAILHHPKALGAPLIATRIGVPLFLASPIPGFTPTAAFPSPLLPFSRLGPLNRPSHALMIHASRFLFPSIVRAWKRKVLGLDRGERPTVQRGTLYGYSPLALPRPNDWGNDVAVTGYWFLDSPEWEPDPALRSFLSAGEAPVYVGFGSMPSSDPVRLASLVIDGLRRAGKRGLLATAGGAILPIDPGGDMYFIARAPHDRLFPLVDAVVHHGGAGTTGAALRAGRPMAICPFIGDQSFWARRMKDVGVGPIILDKQKMDADALATALRAMDSQVVRERASELGYAVQAENGVASAVEFIERQLTKV